MKKARIVAAITAASSVVLLAAGPVLAVDVNVSGNGSSSDNQAIVSVVKSTEIFQTNQANIKNSVTANANTGDNSANKNTGGDTSIKTGDSSTSVNLSNNANSNKTSTSCCGDPVSGAVSISGNGADSNNKVDFNFNNINSITTENILNINNRVNADANTGGNEAGKNTGGDTSIETGDASVTISIGNSGNSNVVILGAMLPSVKPVLNPVVNPIPGVPSVLGVSKTLPMTGYDYPFGLITSATLGLVSLGLLLRTKASEVEKLLSSFAGSEKLRI